MATNDDLDDFFKKKDRKGNKHKKPTGLLTNNEELLKQLVIVTSATSAFKENVDFDEEEEDTTGINNQYRGQFVEESNGIIGINDDNQKTRSNVTFGNKIKTANKLTVQDNYHHINEEPSANGQQDEWEEFENSNPRYDQLRLKFSRGANDHGISDNREDEDYDDQYGNNHGFNDNDNPNNIDGDTNEQSSRANRRREQQQQKDKPVWKLDQVKAPESTPIEQSNDTNVDNVAELPPPKSVTADVYRPPQLRGNSSITIVSGVSQRVSKKEKPNLASTEEFPALGAAVNRK